MLHYCPARLCKYSCYNYTRNNPKSSIYWLTLGAQIELTMLSYYFFLNLYRHRQKIEKLKTEAVAEHGELIKAMSTFVELLKDADVDHSGTISREELRRALEKVSMG